MTNFITLTPSAIKKAIQLRDEAGYGKQVPLRVGIKGGGCAGYERVLFFDENNPEINPNDNVIELENLLIVSDEISSTYLEGTTLDYIENGFLGSGFKFSSDKTKSTCGCGNSFSM